MNGDKRDGDSQAMRKRNMIATVILVVLVAVLWHQVFAMTGLLWWNAPGGTQAANLARPAPPPPLKIRPPDTSWVNLQAYLKTHPRWEP